MTTKAQHSVRHKLFRLGLATAVGGLIAAFIPIPHDEPWVARVLIGFVLATLGFAVPLVHTMLHADAARTSDLVEGLDPGRSVLDVIVVVGVLASLVGVLLMLVGPAPSQNGKTFEAVVTFCTVGTGWFLVHTMYALRYARHWFNSESDCIDFHMDADPSYSDFLYTSFCVGSTFAIADTDLKTTAIRRVALKHAWLSYLLGAVTVGATINLIAGLAQ